MILAWLSRFKINQFAQFPESDYMLAAILEAILNN